MLAENLGHPGHAFWADDTDIPAAVRGMEARLQGYRECTDAYLLSLAHRRKSVLATFDRGIAGLAIESVSRALEIIPFRQP